LKVSTNVDIAMQCFENFGGENAPNAPPWLRACNKLRYTLVNIAWVHEP